MAKKITGVPQVWIKMLNQSYVGVIFKRKPDGSPLWLHKKQVGFTADRKPQFEEVEDVGHTDPQSYQRREGTLELPMDKPIKLHADIAAGLLATSQAEWCVAENEGGHDFNDIMEAFCPEAHRARYEAMAGALS